MNLLFCWAFFLFSWQFVVEFCNCQVDGSFNVSNLLRNFQGRNVECGQTGRFKRLQMRNPSRLPEECEYTISPSSRFVCQVRIDFDIILQSPTSEDKKTVAAECKFDSFTVGDLKLCGVNQYQHIYVPFNITRFNRRETLTLKFTVADRFKNPNLGFVSWNLRVTQLECPNGSPRIESNRSLMKPLIDTLRAPTNDGWLIAPVGCLQYYPDAAGSFESFNYNGGRGPYLSDLTYAICFRRRSNDNQLKLVLSQFKMDSAKADQPAYGEECFPKAEAKDTIEDYVFIPRASVTGEKVTRTSALCGKIPDGSIVTSNMIGPFVITFHSDNGSNEKHKKQGGFRIEYQLEQN